MKSNSKNNNRKNKLLKVIKRYKFESSLMKSGYFQLKETQKRLEASSRSLSILNKCNEALLYINDEEKLLEKVCEIIVKYGGYKYSWIGKAVNDKNKSIVKIASCGNGDRYLKSSKISWANAPLGRGPTGTAVRTCKVTGCKNMATDIKFSPWVIKAKKFGYKSSIVLPFKIYNEVYVISIYSDKVNNFSNNEISVLRKLVNNLVYGLKIIHVKKEQVKVKNELVESEYFFKESQSAAHIGSYKLNFKTGKWNSSHVLDNIFGIDEKENKSIASWIQMVYKDDRKMMSDYFKNEVVGKHKSFNKEYRIICKKSKKIKWVHGLGKLTLDKNKKLLLMIGTIQDITERKNIDENTAIANREIFKLHKAVETTSDIVYMTDKEGIITYINSQFTKIYGYKSSEVVGKVTPRILKSGFRKKAEYTSLWKNLVSGKIVKDEHYNKTKNGKLIIVESSINPIISENGKIIGYFSIQRDITARKIELNEIRKSDTIIKNVNSVIIKWEKDGTIDYMNDYGLDIFGYKNKNEVIGKQLNMLIPKKESTGKDLSNLVDNIINKPQKYIFNENENIRKDGSRFWVAWTNRAIKDKKGNLLGIITVGNDITFLKKTEQNYKKLSFMVENTVEGHAIINFNSKKSKLLFVNKAWEQITGYKSEDVVNKKEPFIISSLKYNPELKKILMSALKSNSVFHQEMIWATKNNNKIIVDVLCMPIMGEDNVVEWFNTIRDITDKKKREQLFNEEKNRNESILSSIGDATFACDKNGYIILYNKVAEQLSGVLTQNAIDNYYEKIISIVNEKGKNINLNYINKFIKKNKSINTDNNMFLVRMDGRKIPISISISPVKDKSEILIGFVVVFRDMTKVHELEMAKNDFLSITSHQLRTPLSATKWVLETLFSDANPTEKQKEKYNYLNVSNERLINLVNRLLNVSRIESGRLSVNKRVIDLEELINKLITSFKALIEKKNKIIQIEILDNIHKVYCDPILVNEIVENLLINAIYYSPKDSKIIKFTVIKKDDDYILSVHNDGYIDQVSADRLRGYNKFVRGSGASEIEPAGSGLGLYITKKMSEISGGNAWFESSSKAGTTFYISIKSDPKKEYN